MRDNNNALDVPLNVVMHVMSSLGVLLITGCGPDGWFCASALSGYRILARRREEEQVRVLETKIMYSDAATLARCGVVAKG